MSKKKIKVKVIKRKLNIKKILVFFLILVLTTTLIYYIVKKQISNIYIIGNDILSDIEIIDMAQITDYPSFISTRTSKIEKKLKENMYIKDVKVKKKLNGKIYIYITEKKVLCIYNNKLLLEDSNIIDNTYNATHYPILISDISNIEKKFVSSFSKVEDSVLLKISEIEYAPNEVDDGRFVLKMNDGNLVYVTLDKITKINKYNSIYSSLEGNKGIIYLDSGDYVEIKDE